MRYWSERPEECQERFGYNPLKTFNVQREAEATLPEAEVAPLSEEDVRIKPLDADSEKVKP